MTDRAAAPAAVLHHDPLLLGPMLWSLPETEELVFTTLDVFIWAVFAADLAVKLAVAQDRPRFVKRNRSGLRAVAAPNPEAELIWRT